MGEAGRALMGRDEQGAVAWAENREEGGGGGVCGPVITQDACSRMGGEGHVWTRLERAGRPGDVSREPLKVSGQSEPRASCGFPHTA